MVLVKVKAVHAMRTRSRKAMVTADVTDGSGFLKVTFFNQPYRERQLKPGTQVVLFGKVELFRGRRQMTNPVVDLVGDKTGRIVPVYPQSEKAGIMSWDVDRWMTEVLDRAGEFADPGPGRGAGPVVAGRSHEAFHDIHQPETMARGDGRPATAGVRRAAAGAAAAGAAQAGARAHDAGHRPRHRRCARCSRFHERLPFPLTGAQERAIDEIDADLAGPHPMHRLLQGDVGSGKTVVAVSALLVAVQGGHQGALMAPTEVLAEQHHLGVRGAAGRLHRARHRRVDPVRRRGPRAGAAGRAAHQPHHRGRAAPHPGRAGRRSGRPGHRHPRPDPGVDRVPLARRRRDRRAAPLRRRAAGRAAGQERGRGRARRAGDDGHADPAHRGDDRLRRPRRVGARRAAARSHADRHDLGPSRGRRGRGVGDRPRAGGGRTPGLRRVPADRREREARGALGRGDLRAAAGRASCPGLRARAAARPGDARREGEGDGAVPLRWPRRAGGHHGDRGRRRRARTPP